MSSEQARKRFYVYSNWLYQAGVFASRSSGMLWQVGGSCRRGCLAVHALRMRAVPVCSEGTGSACGQ